MKPKANGFTKLTDTAINILATCGAGTKEVFAYALLARRHEGDGNADAEHPTWCFRTYADVAARAHDAFPTSQIWSNTCTRLAKRRFIPIPGGPEYPVIVKVANAHNGQSATYADNIHALETGGPLTPETAAAPRRRRKKHADPPEYEPVPIEAYSGIYEEGASEWEPVEGTKVHADVGQESPRAEVPTEAKADTRAEPSSHTRTWDKKAHADVGPEEKEDTQEEITTKALLASQAKQSLGTCSQPNKQDQSSLAQPDQRVESEPTVPASDGVAREKTRAASRQEAKPKEPKVKPMGKPRIYHGMDNAEVESVTYEEWVPVYERWAAGEHDRLTEEEKQVFKAGWLQGFQNTYSALSLQREAAGEET